MKRRTLIIGNAMLFAACLPACDDDPAPAGGDLSLTADGGGDRGRPDQTPTDATADQRLGDEGPAADMQAADLSAPDEGPTGDMTAADLAPPDMAAPDLAPPDMSPPDMSPPDMSPPDMSPPDMSPPDMSPPDMAAPDMAPPGPCEALRGQPCRPEDDGMLGCCDAEGGEAVLVCEQGSFREPVNYPFCNCEPGGPPPQRVFCAVPGFVGVHRSGWRPEGVIRLRRGARHAA